MQNIGFAAFVPAFLALHLFTSPTATAPSAENVRIDPAQLNALPISMILGLFVPTIAMSLPAPSVISITQKQTLAAFWQGFPLWIYIVQSTLVFLISSIAPTNSRRSSAEKNATCVQTLRGVYMFGIACSALGHIGTWSISLLAMLCPGVFASGIAELLHPSNVFMNASPFSRVKAADVADGSKWFLQWDLLIGSSTVLLWAVALGVQAKSTRPGLSSYVSQFVFLGLVSLAIGPSGAAVVAFWARDELVLGRVIKQKQ